MTILFVRNDEVFTQMMIFFFTQIPFWAKKLSFDDFIDDLSERTRARGKENRKFRALSKYILRVDRF